MCPAVCCNMSRTPRFPNQQNIRVSTSVFIDTLRPRDLARASEVVIATVPSQYHGGTFALNIRHVPLSAEEYALRGGDKVKILGLSSC